MNLANSLLKNMTDALQKMMYVYAPMDQIILKETLKG